MKLRPQITYLFMEMENVTPFDSFVFIYKVLTFIGFAKLKKKPKYKILEHLFSLYRFIGCTWVTISNIQEFGYIFQVSDDTDSVIECLLIALPHMNGNLKMLNSYWHSTRLEKVNKFLEDRIFAADTERDRKLLRQYRDFMNKFTKFVITSVVIVILLWFSTTFISRMNDTNFTSPIYVPFKTDTSTGFLLSAFSYHGPVIWFGFGQLTLDALIVGYYSQAVIQLKIIRQNLEHLTDSDEKYPIIRRPYRYIDELDNNVIHRFQYCVKRYVKVLWYINEVNAIFAFAIANQFLLTSAMLGVGVYQMTKGNSLLGNMGFYVGYFLVIQSQAFVFCFCGQLIKYESLRVSDSMYLCDWYKLSPKLRKVILIGMSRWNVPIDLKVSGVVPIALSTYFKIIRLTFNLFALMKSANSSSAEENKYKALSF